MNVQLKNPITVVPWNGFSGAVTFTFDDGTESQAKNLNFLDEIPEAKVTFFVCTKAVYFGSGHREKHLEFAGKGHELGNHTVNHLNMTEPGVNFRTEISEAGRELRNLGLEITSFATPFCAQNEAVKDSINLEHFISRSCNGVGICDWDEEPDWMEIPSKDWPEKDGNVADFKKSIDDAVSGKWLVQLFHGVGGDWFSIEPKDLEELVRYAVAKNLWVSTFSQVGAYYRAHFAMERASAISTNSGIKVSWMSPHAHMPKSVPMRVRIENVNNRNVLQKGKIIKPNEDGSYTVEFMDSELALI